MNKKNLKNNGAILLLLVIAIGFLFIWKFYAPTSQTGTKTISVHVDHLEGEDTDFTFTTDGEYLSDALAQQENFVDGPTTEYGLFIETVDGETVDSNNQEWWGYTINGELAVYGVDQQVIQDGDEVVFTLNVGY